MLGKKLGLALAAWLMLAACGNNAFSPIADKNSDAAKTEDVQIAINKGDYTAAISIMGARCPNKTCTTKSDTQLYAAAYMGEAGIDVLTIAKNADASKNSTSTSSDFAVISKGIPSPTAANLASIANGIAVLNNSKGTLNLKPTSAFGPRIAAMAPTSTVYSSEQKDILLQLGLSQATATILAIGSQLGGFDTNGIPVNCNGNCTSAASKTAITAALNATYTPPGGTATTYASYAATSLIDGSVTLLKVFSSDNSTASAINNLSASIHKHTGNVKGSCTWKVVSTLRDPLAFTGTSHTTTTIDAISSTSMLVAGRTITGSGIPANTTISTVSANSITISQATTTSTTAQFSTPALDVLDTASTPYTPSFNSADLVSYLQTCL